jgi:hypothetical protein
MSPDDRIAPTSALPSSESLPATTATSRSSRRRISTAAFAATALAFAFMTACNDASITSPTNLAAPRAHTSDLTPPPTTGDEVVDLLIPFMSPTQMNVCRGELVYMQNQNNQNAHFDISTSSDGNLHVEIHYNNMGVHGYAITPTGTVNYNNGEVADWVWNIDGPPPLEQTQTINTHLIRQGEDALSSTVGDDFFYHQTLHVTVNAQGVPTAQVTNVSADCR